MERVGCEGILTARAVADKSVWQGYFFGRDVLPCVSFSPK